jgi:hypothetical protein
VRVLKARKELIQFVVKLPACGVCEFFFQLPKEKKEWSHQSFRKEAVARVSSSA